MSDSVVVTRGHRNLLLAAAGLGTILIGMGGIVCSTNSSGGCPDWPMCHGSLVPPLKMNSILEYGHRATAGLTLLLVLAAAVAGMRNKQSGRTLLFLPVASVVLLLIVATFGAFAILTGLTWWQATIDLGTALIALAVLVTAAVIAFISHDRTEVQPPSASGSLFRRLSFATLGAYYLVVVSGIAAARGSVMRCVGGPLHFGSWSSIADPSWAHTPRQSLGMVVALLAVALVTTSVRSQNIEAGTRRWTLLFAGLFVSELALNAAMVSAGATAPLLVLSVAATTGAWGALTVVAVRAQLLMGRPVPQAAAALVPGTPTST